LIREIGSTYIESHNRVFLSEKTQSPSNTGHPTRNKREQVAQLIDPGRLDPVRKTITAAFVKLKRKAKPNWLIERRRIINSALRLPATQATLCTDKPLTLHRLAPGACEWKTKLPTI
jgi:hypothetical protein